MKKLVYVIEDFRVCGGVERIVADKANALSTEYGHEVTIISVYRDDRKQGFRLEPGVRLVSLLVPMAARSGNPIVRTASRVATLLRAARRLNSTLKGIRPDVVFFATTLSALLLPLCKTKARKIFESHSARKFTPYNKLFLPMERTADMVVCLTEDDAKAFKHAKCVRVIPNFISAPRQFVSDYSIKKAIAVGRLEHEKGFDLLIASWRQVAERCPDWQLHIYGEGSCRQQLQGQIDSLGLGGVVKLCGRCADMVSRYAEYSLQIVSSRYEGLSITLVEGQSCGLPAVTVDYEYGARQIVKNGVNAIIVPQGEGKALSDAIIKLACDESLRRSYGLEARKTIRKFSKERIMKMWQEVIKGS